MTMRLIFLAVMLGLSCSPATKDGAKAPAKKKKIKLVLATNSEPDTLDPIFQEMAVSTAIRFFGQRELTMNNEKWEIVPDLAVEIPTVENGGVKITTGKDKEGKEVQKMVVTWKIRADAKWDDGDSLLRPA